jgi:hypothetical protein
MPFVMSLDKSMLDTPSYPIGALIVYQGLWLAQPTSEKMPAVCGSIMSAAFLEDA